MHPSPTQQPGIGGTIRESAWLVIPIASLGLLTVFPLLRIARRTGDTAIKMVAAPTVPMTVLFWLAFPLSSDAGQPDNAWDAVGASMLFALWVVGSIVCIFFVNRRYLAWKRKTGRMPLSGPAPVWGSSSSEAPQDVATVQPVPWQSKALGLDDARSQYLAATSNMAAPTAPVVDTSPPTRPDSAPPPAWNAPTRSPSPALAQRMDINSAAESDLRAVPGVGPVLAKRILEERRQRGGFRSIDELADLGVPPHVLMRLRDAAVVRPLPGRPPASGGRVLDL